MLTQRQLRGEEKAFEVTTVSQHWCLSLSVAFKGYWNSQPQSNIYRMGLNHIMSQGFWGMEQMPREWPAQSMQSILGLVFLSWSTPNTSHWSPMRMKSNTLAYLTFCSEKSLFINSYHPKNITLNLCSGGWETQQRRLPITWRLRMHAWHVWYNSLLTRNVITQNQQLQTCERVGCSLQQARCSRLCFHLLKKPLMLQLRVLPCESKNCWIIYGM